MSVSFHSAAYATNLVTGCIWSLFKWHTESNVLKCIAGSILQTCVMYCLPLTACRFIAVYPVAVETIEERRSIQWNRSVRSDFHLIRK
jgi:hypothetical protein